jgi:hypothetical protein
MCHFKTLLGVPAVALILFAATPARAGNIAWHYNWEPGALTLFGDSGNKGGFITFTDNPLVAAVNNSDIVATNIRTVSGAAPELPDRFTSTGSYTLSLKITDDASGQSGTLIFSGKLSGTFSQSNANVTNKFTGQITQQLVLGSNTYTVTIGGYTLPGPPKATNAGSISAHVIMNGATVTSNNPEPSTLALASFGLTVMGAGWWRRRRAMPA